MNHFNSESALRNTIKKNKAEIIDAMAAAISATERSFNPFGKKQKVQALQKFMADYRDNESIDSLIGFIKEASRPRRFLFFSSSLPNSMREFTSKVSNYSFLQDFLQKILDHLKTNPNTKSTDILPQQTAKATHYNQSSFKEGQQDNNTASETDEDSLEEHLSSSEEEGLTGSNTSTTSTNTKLQNPGNYRERVPQAEDPLRTIDPEKITAFADMGRKIKLIKRDIVKQMLHKRYGENKPKKKNIASQELEATPDQLSELKKILLNVGYLSQSPSGELKKIIFAEDEKQQEATAIEQAASQINTKGLLGLAYNDELKIAKWQYNSIQSRAKEQKVINTAYANALPEDDGFVGRLLENIKPHYPKLTALTFSEQHYPFSEDVFNQLLEQGLSDAEKINKLCGEILKIDTKTLLDKINKGLFMSGRTEVKIDDFFRILKSRLSEIDWSFDKLVEKQEELESDGLKLDINLIRTAQIEAPKNTDEGNASQTPKRPPPAFLGQIGNKERRVNPMAAAIKSASKLKPNETSQEIEQRQDRPVNPMAAAIKSAPKLKSSGESQEKPSSQDRPINPMAAAIKSAPKLKSTENTSTNTTSGPAVAKSFTEKQAMLGAIGGSPKLKTTSSPTDLSGKNIITVKSKNSNFINLVAKSLAKQYTSVVQKETSEGYEFTITDPRSEFKKTEEIMQSMRYFANQLVNSGFSPFKEVIFIEKYNPVFLQELNSESLQITYNVNYESKRLEFEHILTRANALFVRQGNKYIINKSNWNTELLTALKTAKYTDDCFIIDDKDKNKEIIAETKRQLTRDIPVAKFNLNIPSAALRNKLTELFNGVFGKNPESFLDASRFMVIGKDKLDKFTGFLQQLSSLKNDSLKGEYIQTDDDEFATIIKQQLQHRLKISISHKKDNTEIREFFANTANTRVAEEQDREEVVYYVNLATLEGKKEKFFNLAAQHGLNIEYYDSETKQYKAIDDATDSQNKHTLPEHGTSKQGIFAHSPIREDNEETDKENRPRSNLL